MRTTLDIDEDVLQAAKELAASRKSTTGKILSELARKALEPPQRTVTRYRNGVPLLPPKQGERPVTMAIVNSLRDDE
jgi:hypothetical protein